MFFGHIFFVILDILKIFCSDKHQIFTDLLNYLELKMSKLDSYSSRSHFLKKTAFNKYGRHKRFLQS